MAIRDVLHRYALGIDRGDPEMLRSCFAEDVEAEYGGHALPCGVDSILRLVAGAGDFVSTIHHAGTVVITALMEEAAENEHYAVTYLLSRQVGGLSLTIRGVHYSDAFRRRNTGWSIARRAHRVLWSIQSPAIAEPPLPAEFLARRASRRADSALRDIARHLADPLPAGVGRRNHLDLPVAP